jgi:pimeloyl-ACP methyl ester carboxylesterase
VTAVLLLDGRPVGEVAVGAEPRLVDLALPAWPSAADVVPLEILSPVRRAGAADGGRRGVAVFWVAVTRRADVRRAHPDGAAVGGAGTSWRPRLGLGVDPRREAVSFPSGRLTLRADLFHPPGRRAGAVVLAHGASPLGRRHGLYLGLARRLAERGYLVLSPDLRGYGESEDPARVASAADLDFAADLVAATDYLQERFGSTRVTVVGHSFGGGVALAAAARDPRVAGVVAVSPGRRAYEVVLGTAEQRRQIRDRMIGEMGLRAEQFPVELVDAVVVPIIVDSYVDRPFRAPVLFVDGALEDAADLRFLHALSRRMQAATAYVTIPRADHYFGVQREMEERDPVVLERLAEVVDGWIREGDRWERTR